MARGATAEVGARIAEVLDLFPSRDTQEAVGQQPLGRQQMLAARCSSTTPTCSSSTSSPSAWRRSWCSACSSWSTAERAADDGHRRAILNIALAISDRAIFLEKGEVKFEGSTSELLERDDLARAVFFGTEGG